MLLIKEEVKALRKLVKGISGLTKNISLRYIKFDYKEKKIVATDGFILVTFQMQTPNDYLWNMLGIYWDVLIPFRYIEAIGSVGKIVIRNMIDEADLWKVDRKVRKLLYIYNESQTDYVLTEDFICGENEFVAYEDMLKDATEPTENALFSNETLDFKVTTVLPRFEDGIRTLDPDWTIKASKEYWVSEGFVNQKAYRIVTRTPKKL